MVMCQCKPVRKCEMCVLFDKSLIIKDVLDKKISQKEAANRLQCTIRHVKRLVRKYRKEGLKALQNQKKGACGRKGYPSAIKEQCLALVKEKHHDFGPKFAAQKLLKLHGIKVSKETLRKWMIEANIWKLKPQRVSVIHPPRARRACYGELIQMDGSLHPWFEDRGAKATLLVCTDDATSRLQAALFANSESTLSYFSIFEQYVKLHGKPSAFYTDKHSVFKVNRKDVVKGKCITIFGKAMANLNIELIHANSAPAKGRVERMNATLQDRLVKELRLQGISTIEEANAYLPQFISEFNEEFGKPPLSNEDAHKPMKPCEFQNLANWFAASYNKKVSKNLTIQHNNQVILLETIKSRRVKNDGVTLHELPTGEIEIYWNEEKLNFRVVEDKRKKRIDKVFNRTDLNAYLDGMFVTNDDTVAANVYPINPILR